MPLLFFAAAACGLVLSGWGAAGALAGAAYAPPDARSFTVMTFNLHHGIDGTSRYNLQRAVDAIARIRPGLVGLQEVTRNHSSYRCDDQPALLAAGLERATGRPWHHAYVKEWTVHTDRACLARGLGDGPNTEGLAFLAPEPIEVVGALVLPKTRLALAARVPATRGVPVIVTHLTHGSQGAPDRARQVAMIREWAAALGRPHVLMGDLNAPPGAPELAPLLPAYRDAWAEAAAAGAAGGVPRGTTQIRAARRIDYVFFTPGADLRLRSVDTIDTSALIAVHASDHHPVLASFRVP